MKRLIILKKDLNDRYLEGYFITEEKSRLHKKPKTIIQKVIGDKLLKKVVYLEKVKHDRLMADDFIQSLYGFEIIKDQSTYYNKKGYKTIDDLKDEAKILHKSK